MLVVLEHQCEIGSHCNCLDNNDKEPFSGFGGGMGLGEFGVYLGDSRFRLIIYWIW